MTFITFVILFMIFYKLQIVGGKAMYIIRVSFITFGTMGAYIGFSIGDFCRKKAKPDMTFYSGLSGLLPAKIFWSWGINVIDSVVVAFVAVLAYTFIIVMGGGDIPFGGKQMILTIVEAIVLFIGCAYSYVSTKKE
jgi:hypothetical protein